MVLHAHVLEDHDWIEDPRHRGSYNLFEESIISSDQPQVWSIAIRSVVLTYRFFSMADHQHKLNAARPLSGKLAIVTGATRGKIPDTGQEHSRPMV